MHCRLFRRPDHSVAGHFNRCRVVLNCRGEMRCPQRILDFPVTVGPGCDNFLLSFSARWSEICSHDGTSFFFDFVFVLDTVQGFLSSKFHVCFNELCATSVLLTRQNGRNFDCLSTLLHRFTSRSWTKRYVIETFRKFLSNFVTVSSLI